MQTRKCHADTNAKENRIRTKNNMSPSPSVGDVTSLTLQNRLRSPKQNQLFIMSQCYIHVNLVEICQPVHDMVHTGTFWHESGSLSPTVTLKIRSRSPKPNQLFIMSQCYSHANLVKIHPPVHDISCKQESVTPTPTRSAPKTMSPSPSVGDITSF